MILFPPYTQTFFSVDHELINNQRHELVAANQKITKLEKNVQDLKADVLSSVQPSLDTKVDAYEDDKVG